MSSKKETETSSMSESTINAFAQLQEAGLGNMAGLSAAWMETLGDMGAEVASFVAERIKEDVKTQHQIMHCRNAAELQHIQSQFIQKAIDQYQTEMGKLVDMGSKTFVPKTRSDDA